MKHFGVDRVVEPKGSVPVTAWKLDNEKRIRPDEIRISIERVHVEWDSFQQICTSCSYEDERVKARIMELVEKRGKLHNPYTGSGGILLGTIDAIGSRVAENCRHQLGDRVYCVTALMAIPLKIEKIKRIDYEYGQLEASGYGIVFRPEQLFPVEDDMAYGYTMTAIDEAGNFYKAAKLVRQNGVRRVAILGRDLYTTLIYAYALRESANQELSVIAIMDETSFPGMGRQEIETMMRPEIQQVYLVDETEPLASYEMILSQREDHEDMDMVIVGEDIRGAETLAVLLVKDKGSMFFSAIKSNYAQGVFVAETMGKSVKTHYFDQNMDGNQLYVMDLVRKLSTRLDAIEQVRKHKKSETGRHSNKLKSRNYDTAEKIGNFVFQSPVTKDMVEDALNVAQYDCNVIIQGETGVGKEKVLELIHRNSPRRSKPCIKINCATIQENLAEAEFFGYEKGAFTGAQAQGKAGYFELANKGTLFLDEIGSLTLNMQSKLLRVLQENQYYRVGGTQQKSVDVRVICANNVPIKQLVEEGRFREDLYYRLNICMIHVPPLRERKEDIHCLSETFLKDFNRKYGINKELSPEAMMLLCEYHWPGNVRELENVVQRLIINSRETIVGEDLVDELLNKTVYDEMMLNVQKAFRRNDAIDFNFVMEQQEKKIIAYALKKEGTTRKAAQFLNLPQATLARKKVKYGL